MRKILLTLVIGFVTIMSFIVIRGTQLDGFFRDPFVIGFFSLVLGVASAIAISFIVKRKK